MLHIYCFFKKGKNKEKKAKCKAKERRLMKMCGFCTVFNLSPPLNTVFVGAIFLKKRKKKRDKSLESKRALSTLAFF